MQLKNEIDSVIGFLLSSKYKKTNKLKLKL